MRLIPPGLRLSALLLAGCGVLGWLMALQWQGRSAGGSSASASVASPPHPVEVPAMPPLAYAPPALATFDEILERPLFVPDRRPAKAPEPAAPAEAPLVPLRARLEGVAQAGGASVAVVRDLITNEGLRLSKGMQFKGWTVDAVEPERTVLKRGDSQVHELKLERQK